MEDQTVSHYRVHQKLGGGGMGVVYKATDTRLKRTVALKFLPPELTRDEDAKRRFMHEAEAASALDHPNICTIFEIDETPDGQLFLVMAYYDGETLKKRIERGPLPMDEAVDIADRAAQGLAKAHASGMVHRDIKPANVMMPKDGQVKIVDFGLAKLMGQTDLTRTGTTLGTVAYMSPEQVAGGQADQRSDVWALGVMLYELLAGQLPFRGDHHLVMMKAIQYDAPQPLLDRRSDVPEDVQAIVAKALEKDPDDRFGSAAELHNALAAFQRSSAVSLDTPSNAARAWRLLLRPKVAAAVLVVLAAIGIGVMTWLDRGADARWAREDAMPEIIRLRDANDYVAALAMAENAEQHIPEDELLIDLLNELSVHTTITSAPSGADVYVREYSAVGADRRHLGQTPLDVRLPRATHRWELEKDGFRTLEFARRTGAASMHYDLDETGSIPDGSVRVAAVNLTLELTGFNYQERFPAPSFLIDRYEVTNQEYQEFVEAGGYSDPTYWTHEFVKDGQTLSWQEAMSEFRDVTGRPGPSIWEGGTYPTGQDDHPVGGVSWYEAAAFAEFHGKSLPSVYHWLRGARTRFAAELTPLSNFESGAPEPVGSREAMSLSGAHDMAGNVKEWCFNVAGDRRYILGGGWDEPAYRFTYPEARPPFDRSAQNGFRCVDYLGEELTERFTGPIPLPARDYERQPPANDEVFSYFQAQYDYDQTPLESKMDEQGELADHWTRERVSFDAAYGNERVLANIYVPTNVDPPYQAVIYFPGTGAIRNPSLPNRPNRSYDFIIQSGRALVFPVYKSTYERQDGLLETWPDTTRSFTEHVIQWVNDTRRTVDYLETRDDIDTQKLAFYGLSWGGRMGAIVPALEPRLKAVVLVAGALSLREARPEANQVNFAPRVTAPVLMLNGRHDFLEPVDTAQRPLFELFGTPEADKKHVIFEEAGHTANLPRTRMITEILGWLDRYLGPV